MSGIELIVQERQRQLDEEGFSAEHDDRLADGQLAIMAACYAVHGIPGVKVTRKKKVPGGVAFVDAWPGPAEKDTRDKHKWLDRLVIAGALILAEIDRVKRLKAREEGV